MKKILRSNAIVLFTILLGLASAPFILAQTPQEKGYQIMSAVDKLPVVEKMMSETTLNIYDTQGKRLYARKSRSAMYHENYNDPDKKLSRAIIYFFAPSDYKGNAALTIEVASEDDKQWTYMKGLRKPKRIVGSDKSSSFMGSDFSNGDLEARDINDYNYTWLATEKIAFKGKSIPVEKIEGTFKDQKKREDYGYSKGIFWVHPVSGLVFKGELYDLNGQLFKRMTLGGFVIKPNRDGKKVFIGTEIEMVNVIKGTKTIMEIDPNSIKVEGEVANINPDIFEESYLTRKWW